MLGKHLDNSFAPFVRMMNDWMCTGKCHDPADEFFVVRFVIKNFYFTIYHYKLNLSLYTLERQTLIIIRHSIGSICIKSEKIRYQFS
jgi:hypothetical protein